MDLPLRSRLPKVAMTRYIKRGGKVWIKIFLISPLPRSPLRPEWVPVKALPKYWVAVVKPGRVLSELADVDEATAREAAAWLCTSCPSSANFQGP